MWGRRNQNGTHESRLSASSVQSQYLSRKLDKGGTGIEPKIHGIAPLYPHSSRSVVSWIFMKRRCHGKKWPWNGVGNHAKSRAGETYHNVNFIGDVDVNRLKIVKTRVCCLEPTSRGETLGTLDCGDIFCFVCLAERSPVVSMDMRSGKFSWSSKLTIPVARESENTRPLVHPSRVPAVKFGSRRGRV